MTSRFRSIIYLLPQLFRTWLGQRITVRFPFAPLKLSPHFRGRVVISPELCRGCGACVRDCPARGLRLERVDRHTFRLIHYPDRCAYCGQCEASCTFGAIRQTNEFVPGTTDREAIVEVLVDAKPAVEMPESN
jgi:formate hydrogenlyase subunit 6/NADH:ubiquinone oxidoreductase subunit I